MKSEIPENYPDRIKQIRLRFSLTQERLSELLGTSLFSINRWEKGESTPSPNNWEKIARAETFGLEALYADAYRTSQLSLSSDKIREDEASYKLKEYKSTHIDFSSEAEIVRLVAEAERLTYGHLFNPSFATEISFIEPLPHQRIAVYEYMLSQTRLRFLLADDAGAGKTIMTGLYIREMLARRLIRRILIVPPAGLVGNWENEMRSLFKLQFKVTSGSEARRGNPFCEEDSDFLIVSIDTLAGERMFSRLKEPSVPPYDLVVFDEAHKLSAHRDPDLHVRKTDRYRLAEVLAGVASPDIRWQLNWSCRHILLLTATPHMGRDYPYFALWRLLEPNILTTPEAFSAFPENARKSHFIRRTKEEMIRFDGTPIYPMRVTDTLSYDLTQGAVSEQALYDQTTEYMRTYYNKARFLNRSAARLAMSVFQRRLASSTYALMLSLRRRLDKLESLITDIRTGILTEEQFRRLQLRLDDLKDDLDVTTADEETMEGEQESHERIEDDLLQGVVGTSLAELEAERQHVESVYRLAKQVYEKGEESKFDRLRSILFEPKYKGEKFIIFTEHRDTLSFLVRRLEGLGFTGQVAQIHGGMHYKDRQGQVEFFRKPQSQGGASVLVATDAAGEGINLQFCWIMINYDVPWNPARLEQRMGRIHRYGQEHDPVFIINLVAGKTREGRVIRTLLDKLENIREELGSDKVFDVVGRLFEGVSIRDYMEEAAIDVATSKSRKRSASR
jgi:SNF2 family DNA or RNA helicase